jgi:hypothetical protein
MYINKYCSTINTKKVWIQMRHKQNKKIFSVSVYVEMMMNALANSAMLSVYWVHFSVMCFSSLSKKRKKLENVKIEICTRPVFEGFQILWISVVSQQLSKNADSLSQIAVVEEYGNKVDPIK